MKTRLAMFCEHANEAPYLCPCDKKCACRGKDGMCSTEKYHQWSDVKAARKYDDKRRDARIKLVEKFARMTYEYLKDNGHKLDKANDLTIIMNCMLGLLEEAR